MKTVLIALCLVVSAAFAGDKSEYKCSSANGDLKLNVENIPSTQSVALVPYQDGTTYVEITEVVAKAYLYNGKSDQGVYIVTYTAPGAHGNNSVSEMVLCEQ